MIAGLMNIHEVLQIYQVLMKIDEHHTSVGDCSTCWIGSRRAPHVDSLRLVVEVVRCQAAIEIQVAVGSFRHF